MVTRLGRSETSGMTRTLTGTTVAIVGGGPAGLMLSHLLAIAGIESVVVELRSRREIEETHRAGILEQDSVRLLVDSGVSDRVLRDGDAARGHRAGVRRGAATGSTSARSSGASCQLYPQTEVFKDLADAHAREGRDVRFGVRDVSVVDIATPRPGVLFTDADGVSHELRCDYLVGADGSRSTCRLAVPETSRVQYFREYPFAWFGILCEAPASAPELIYNHSERGFALISQRTDTLQRMYFQCDPDDRRRRLVRRPDLGGAPGPASTPTATPCRRARSPRRPCCRSAASSRSRCATAACCWPATPRTPCRPPAPRGSTSPWPTSGCSPRSSSARVAKERPDAPRRLLRPRALDRVWKAQHFSYWMTTMLHSLPDATPFDVRRQVGELTTLVDSTRGLDLPRRGIHGLAARLAPGAPTATVHGPCGSTVPTRPQEPACPPA